MNCWRILGGAAILQGPMSLDADHVFLEFSIKLYAWEHAFLRRVLFVRNEEELKMLRKIGIYTVSSCRWTRFLLNPELL